MSGNPPTITESPRSWIRNSIAQDDADALRNIPVKLAKAAAEAVASPRSRFWTIAEVQVLLERFPEGGADACHAVLPHRSKQAIYGQAQRRGIERRDHKGPHKRWETSDQIDRLIRRFYTTAPKKGGVSALADKLGRPRWWVRNRAIRLGVAVPRFKEPDWTPAELELLEANAHKTPTIISRLFKRRGFKRTATAITMKLRRGRFDTTDYDHYNANQLAEAMGVDAKVIASWIEKCDLEANRRGTARTRRQGGDQWWISRKAVRRFIAENVALVDIRKADKFWLVDLLVGKYQ